VQRLTVHASEVPNLGEFLKEHPGKVRRVTATGAFNWEYTNHALVAVGWGEQMEEGKMVKYWLLRNSWGPTWGHGGYVKVLRGENVGGIESQAFSITPDPCRGAFLAALVAWRKKQGERWLDHVTDEIHRQMYSSCFPSLEHVG